MEDDGMDVFERLGLKPVITCATTNTKVGATIMEKRVAQAISDAAGWTCPARTLSTGKTLGSTRWHTIH